MYTPGPMRGSREVRLPPFCPHRDSHNRWMAEGTLLTHINRVRQRHPALYERIRAVRTSQLAERHERVLQNARDLTYRMAR